MAEKDPDRLFNPHGRRHFRRRYSLQEVRVGGFIVLGLVVIAAWVADRGAHPDPELFGDDPRLIPKGGTATAINGRAAPQAGPGTASLGRFETVGGPKVAPPGWRLTGTSQFGPDNLFEKINGREGFYKSYGFRRLDFGALLSEDDRTVDIEWFDLGTASQALGAFSAERAEGATPRMDDGGLSYLHRNMAAVVRGQNYVRFVGGDEEPATQSALEALRTRFLSLDGAPLPWSYALFVGGMGFGPNAVSVEPKDAFSFAFATNVHVAAREDTELFVSARAEGARAHAQEFREGFASLGEKVQGFVKDRYLGTFATARAKGTFVYGIRGAPSLDAAQAELIRLEKALDALPEDVAKRALKAPASDPTEDGEDYEDEEAEYGEESSEPTEDEETY